MNALRIAILSAAIALSSTGISAQEVATPNSNLPDVGEVITQPVGSFNEQINLPDSLIIRSGNYGNGDIEIQHDNSLSLNTHLSSNVNAGNIEKWENGTLYGIGSYTTMPGLGNMSTLAIAATQHIGSWTFTGLLAGSKYHLDNSIYNDFSLSGITSYRLNDHFSLNAFGTYSTNNVFHSMATMPYLSYSSFGGSITYRANDTFSIETGVRRYYDPFSHHWETVPIIAPTVTMWNANISVDMGGFIHQLLQSVIVSAPKNPTLSPARTMH